MQYDFNNNNNFMIKRNFILICVVLLLVSCEEIELPNLGSGNNTDNNEYVNLWIYDEMKSIYLWNTNISSRPNYELKPESFFKSLLISGDRFSWIQEDYVDLIKPSGKATLHNASTGGITLNDIGFEYVGYSDRGVILAQIAYVKPGTHAEEIGLKRGDIFTRVNGVTLNSTNWRTLLSGSETSATITFLDTNTGRTTDKRVNKTARYAENPVFLDKVYEINGHKIGYLVYNFFEQGPTQESYIYDKDLNNAFGRFKNEGISELVLDLRYNSGGSMNSALLLGSMIVPNLNTNNVFIKLEYNSSHQAELIKKHGADALLYKFRNRLYSGETINNAGNTIQRLYVLTGTWTASASELIINSLKPYMPDKIFLIGQTTVGKTVGSVWRYKENDSKNKWGIAPVAFHYFNSEGKADFSNGFAPNIKEEDNRSDKLPLGDPNEQMLKIAIDHITGNDVKSTSSRSGVSEMISIGSSVEQKPWAGKTIIYD